MGERVRVCVLQRREFGFLVAGAIASHGVVNSCVVCAIPFRSKPNPTPDSMVCVLVRERRMRFVNGCRCAYALVVVMLRFLGRRRHWSPLVGRLLLLLSVSFADPVICRSCHHHKRTALYLMFHLPMPTFFFFKL